MLQDDCTSIHCHLTLGNSLPPIHLCEKHRRSRRKIEPESAEESRFTSISVSKHVYHCFTSKEAYPSTWRLFDGER